jgi:hypothetical protein
MMDRLRNTRSPSADQMQSVLTQAAEKGGWRQISGPLFRKYVALFLAVVCVALLSNGLFEIWFSYREHKAALIRIQREQAESAAAKISTFIREIESQVGWTTQLPWSAGTIDQRRFDGLRLSPGAGDHGTRAARFHRQGTAEGFAPCDGRGREPGRHVGGAEICRGCGQEGLLRAGLFPP